MAVPGCVTMPSITVGGKRKLVGDKAENHDLLDTRPVKRISPFLNTPKQRKEEKRQVLRLSYDKLSCIDDPEKCLLRSVLVHNTAKRLQTELMQEGGYWSHMAYPLVPSGEVYRKHFMSRPRVGCELEVLNNSYLYTSASSEVQDIACDELSKALEHSMSNVESESSSIHNALCLETELKKPVVPAVQSHYTQTPAPVTSKKTLNNTGASTVWDYRAYAANLTGAPLIAGGISMGIPVKTQNTVCSPSNAMPVPMETDENKDKANKETDTEIPDVSETKSVTSSDCSTVDQKSTTSTAESSESQDSKAETNKNAFPHKQCTDSKTEAGTCNSNSDYCSEAPPTEDKVTPPKTATPSSAYKYCQCNNNNTRCLCQTLVTSATTLASISHELDSFMTDYLSRTNQDSSRPSLSCAYLSGETDAKKSSSSAEAIEGVLSNLVPVLGGM